MDVIIPHELQMDEEKKRLNHVYARQIKLLKVFFVGKKIKAKSQELFAALFQSTLQTWPLFVIAISMAVCAGTIIWLMVNDSKEGLSIRKHMCRRAFK